MARTPVMSKRLDRMLTVIGWLRANQPATLAQIVAGTGLSFAATSRAIIDIRNHPGYEFVTVPVAKDGYQYVVADTVEQMKRGLLNRAKDFLTRAESWITAGEKATAIATPPDEYALAADITATGKMLKMQAEAILAALK